MACTLQHACSALTIRTLCSRAVIGTIFFVSGVVTLLQTFVGDRLPIIQVRVWFACDIVLRSRKLP